MKVSEAGNVIIPAYITLQQKGYILECMHAGSDDDLVSWKATKGSDEFNASDPLSLLGIIAMIEHRGENWKATDEEATPFMNKYYGEDL